MADSTAIAWREDWLFIGMAVAVMTVGFLTMLFLGYVPGGAAIVAGFMLLGRANVRVVIGAAIVLPVVLWLLFSKLLGFPLP